MIILDVVDELLISKIQKAFEVAKTVTDLVDSPVDPPVTTSALVKKNQEVADEQTENLLPAL